MRVAEIPTAEPTPTPGPTPTVEPYPAPTPTQSAYQENIFTRFMAFLQDLFEAQPVYAAASQAPGAVVAPIGEVYFLLSDHLPPAGVLRYASRGSTTVTLNVDGSINASNHDVCKDSDGNIWVKPKDGKGPGEETGISIKDIE